MQTSSFAISECIPGLNSAGLFVSIFLWHHLSLAIPTCVTPQPPQLFKCCHVDPCSWSCTLTVFSHDKRLHPFPSLADTCALNISVGRTSLAWSQLSYYPDFFPSQHCWETPFSRILHTKPLHTGNRQLILISFLQCQAVLEDLWVSISFSCISSSTYSSQALCVLIIVSLQLQLIACLCRISPRDCKPKECSLSS